MLAIHGNLGELLVLVYLGLAAFAAILANRGGLPKWVIAGAHSLLTLQVLLGLALLIRNPTTAPWTHVVFGLLTIPALGLTFALRKRLGSTRGLIIGSIIVVVILIVAVFTGMARA
jgi:hypothetical protein